MTLHGAAPTAASASSPVFETGQLMLFDFEKDLAGPSLDANGNPIAATSPYPLLARVQAAIRSRPSEGYYLFRRIDHSLIRSARTLNELLRPFGGKAPPHTETLGVPANVLVVRCRASTGCLGARAASTSGNYYYLLRFDPELTGADLVASATRADIGQIGQPVVLLQFTSRGSTLFGKITRAEAQRGARKYHAAGRSGNYLNYVQHFAIVLDGRLESTPYIDFKQNPSGIAGPNAELDLAPGASLKGAKRLALVLQTGALPVSLVQVSRRVIR